MTEIFLNISIPPQTSVRDVGAVWGLRYVTQKVRTQAKTLIPLNPLPPFETIIMQATGI